MLCCCIIDSITGPVIEPLRCTKKKWSVLWRARCGWGQKLPCVEVRQGTCSAVLGVQRQHAHCFVSAWMNFHPEPAKICFVSGKDDNTISKCEAICWSRCLCSVCMHPLACTAFNAAFALCSSGSAHYSMTASKAGSQSRYRSRLGWLIPQGARRHARPFG